MNQTKPRPHYYPKMQALPPGWDYDLASRYLAKVGKSQAQLDFEQQSIRSRANAELLRASGMINGKGRPVLPESALSKKQSAVRQRNHRAKLKREQQEEGRACESVKAPL